MNNIKENFDTMTKDDNILSDIDTNPFATPGVDNANQNIKKELDSLIATLKSKQATVTQLQDKIRKEAIKTAVELNEDKNVSGKNLYFNDAPSTNVFDIMRPIGITTRQLYEEKLAPITVESTQVWGPNKAQLVKKQDTRDFMTGLYYLSQWRSVTKEIPLVTIPLRPAGQTGGALLNQLKVAANNSFTTKMPNANKMFRYSIAGKYPDVSNKKIVDFNLSYINHLPDFLMSANFISIGYNGYIYVGIEVAEVPLGNSSSFLDVLINNHFGPGSNTPRMSATFCSADYGSNVPTSEGGAGDYPGHVRACPEDFPTCKNYIPNVHMGLCQSAGTSEGKTGFFESTEFYGNQKANLTGEAFKAQEQVAEGLSKFFQEEAVIAADIFRNPFLFLADEADSAVWQNIANIDAAEGKMADSVQSEIVYLGVLTASNGDIIGPPTNGNISTIFTKGGLQPMKYLGCYKDFPEPNRVLPEYGGINTVEGCVKAGHEKGFNLIGVQDGGPGGVGNQNYSNGQCWFSNKSMNALPECDDAVKQVEKDAVKVGEKFLMEALLGRGAGNAINIPKPEKPHGLCKVADNECSGNPAIGGPWRNAMYQNNNAPSNLGCHFFIVPFGSSDKAGSIKYVYRIPGSQETRSVIIWSPNTTLDKSILLPYIPENTGDPNTGRDGITNLTNSTQGIQKGETIDFIWGLNGGSRRYLYSEDYYFRLDLNTKLNRGEDLNKVFMNISNSFTRINAQPSKYQSLFDYNTTGLKCIVNTDIVGFSQGNIGSTDPRINKVFRFLMTLDNPFPDFTKSIGEYNILYTINPIENDLLGRLGFIDFTETKNSNNTPYNLRLYPKDKTNHSGKGPARFVETPGSLKPDLLPSGAFNPSFEAVQQSIKFLKEIGTKSDCAKACYNNLETCQAYDFTNDNECYNFLNKEDITKDLLEAQQGLLSYNGRGNSNFFQLRIPNIQNAETCPNPIKDPLVTATLPSATANPKFSTFKSGKFDINTYYNISESDDISLCNVGKIINNDEQKLKQLQDEIVQIADRFDSLVSSLESKEREIYKKLLNNQERVEEDYNIFEALHEKLKTQDFSVPDTLKASVKDSEFNLMNSNYNFIIWTIIAIGIIIAAIHFGRNLKKK